MAVSLKGTAINFFNSFSAWLYS